MTQRPPVPPPLQELALYGGPPALQDVVPRWPPEDEAIAAAVAEALRDGDWGRYHGRYTRQLAERLAAHHDTPYVTLCSSGTVAVELALRGLGIGPGDEVIVAGYDFPGNFRAVEAVGARPVLVDLRRGDATLDVDQLHEAAGPKTRGVIVAHLHGSLAAMQRIVSMAQTHGWRVVEDACQCPGAVVDGRPAGSHADAGVLSFGGSKLLTSGRGGAVLTRDAAVHQRIRVYAQRGNDAFPLSELQAAVLLPQWDRLPHRNAQRWQAVARLHELLRGVAALRPLPPAPAGAQPAYYKLGWYYCAEHAGGHSREAFIAAVAAEGVPLDAGFRGFVRRGDRRCRHVGPLHESRRAAENMVLLHHPVLLEGDETIQRLAQAVIKVVRAFAAAAAEGSAPPQTIA
jgi:perosamine synthetase